MVAVAAPTRGEEPMLGDAAEHPVVYEKEY